jgi:hypothetical protein
MGDDQLLRNQSRHDPGRWRVGERRTHRGADGAANVTYVVTRIAVVGNEEHVFGIETPADPNEVAPHEPED